MGTINNIEKRFATNTFYYYASLYTEKDTTFEEIQSINMTQEFEKEIIKEIENDELVKIHINAKVRMGKSTLAIWLAMWVYKLMIKLGKRKDKEPFGMQNICRDQQEYSKKMRDPNTWFTVLMVDEDNELENTGQNVTVERALSDVFSNVQAGRYVHTIFCSPFTEMDPNVDIYLEITAIDRKTRTTHCHLYYKLTRGGIQDKVFLGYVNFEIGDLVEIWDKRVKKHFMKKEKDKKDLKIIKRWQNKDFYTNYMIKKYEKMDLITKEGILKPRILDYAEAILEIEEELRALSKLGLVKKETIKNYVKMKCKEKKLATSIVGEELMTQEIIGITELWKSLIQIKKRRKSTEKEINKGNMDEELFKKQKTLQEIEQQITKVIEKQLQELHHYKEINKRYREGMEK